MAKFPGGGGTFASFGNLVLMGGGLTARVDVAANAPAGVWVSYTFAFDAATWGVSDADWATILASVTRFGIPTDVFDGADTIGIDNVKLESAATSVIPLPAGMSLLLTGLFGLGLARKRR